MAIVELLGSEYKPATPEDKVKKKDAAPAKGKDAAPAEAKSKTKTPKKKAKAEKGAQ
jgi:hypothetical protein